MAKSLRSKWRRKCRAVKRERYGKKELDRLKKTLGIGDNQAYSKDINMSEIAEIATVTTAQEIKENQKQTDENDAMDLDEYTKRYNPKTLRDKNGAYPIWLHPRKIRNKKNGISKKKKNSKNVKSKKHK